MAFAASLRRRPVLAALARIARARGIEAWIVGGAPRDGLLGRPPLDVDLALSGSSRAVARELESLGFGTAVTISEGTPSVYRVAGRVTLDLADVEGGSIQSDLARRDFTVNAIAIELPSRRWIDPFGGTADLARGRLRLVKESNLREDPLRAFRAARLYATHGLRPDRATRAACSAAAPALESVAAERIQAELAKMLEARQVARSFRWAAAAGLLSPALGLQVPPARWSAAARILERLNGVAARLPPARRRVLRLAGIAAGVGLSPPKTSGWLRRRRHSRAEAGSVATLLGLAEAARSARTERRRWAWIHDAGSLLPDALILISAVDPRLKAVARRLERLARRRRRGPSVTGRDVIRWLDQKPGPAVGRLLREVRIEALRGSVRTRPQARRWLELRNGAAANR